MKNKQTKNTEKPKKRKENNKAQKGANKEKPYPMPGPLPKLTAAFGAGAPRCDVGVLDRTTMNGGVDPSWYWDHAHVLGILNEQYNHQMIKMVCPE